jgi:hypothetical protein
MIQTVNLEEIKCKTAIEMYKEVVSLAYHGNLGTIKRDYYDRHRIVKRSR